eukprot:TRINITY_DN8608_c0_g2_i1.p3 TRINITY_DN8608_c0_g2~~TRINITY_DN8608_c0_g2_i1.p3  ORF type:complete len:100 (+),score=6.79 TRINITY_DN8608_c0_g2_i1:351-650(+)
MSTREPFNEHVAPHIQNPIEGHHPWPSICVRVGVEESRKIFRRASILPLEGLTRLLGGELDLLARRRRSRSCRATGGPLRCWEVAPAVEEGCRQKAFRR